MLFRFLFPLLGLLLVSATSLQGRATISWRDNSTNERGFKIERAVGDGPFARIATVGANTTTYVDTSLLAGLVYRYRVCAYNAAGDSSYSNVVIHDRRTVLGIPVPELGALKNLIFPTAQLSTAVDLVAGAGVSNEALVIVASSSNPGLIPHPQVRVASADSTRRTLQLKRIDGKYGSATITVAASNGQRVAYRRFTVTVPRQATSDAMGEVFPSSARAQSSTRMVNASARAMVGSDNQNLVVGFNVAEQNSVVLVRAAGPALGSFVGAAALPDPILALYRGNLLLDENQNWDSSPEVSAAVTSVGAFPFKTTSRDAGLLQTLAPRSYTAEVRGANHSGVVLAELYHVDWEAASTGRLSNISCRASVDGGDGSLVIGFTVRGSSRLPLLVRAVGRSLADFGVTEAIGKPKLRLHRDQMALAMIEGWTMTPKLIEAGFAVGAFPLTHTSDSATVLTLSPGNYTLQITGSDGSGGIVLAELYELP